MPSISSTASTDLPVSYPAVEVARLVDDCRAVAGGLADDLARRADPAGIARAGWTGLHRRKFDGTYAVCTAALGDLHDRLLRLAKALRADQDAADHENAQRAVRRAEADAEHRRQEQVAASSAVALTAVGP